MKSPTLFLMCGAICALVFAQQTMAQSEGSGGWGTGITGYTSIDYDSATSTLTAYSETDLDLDAQFDYLAYVYLTLTDGSGNVLGYTSARDDSSRGWVGVLIQAPADPATQYTAKGIHKAYALLYDYDYDYSFYPYRQYTYYYDTLFFGTYEGQNILTPYYYSFLGPGPVRTRRSRYVSLGTTYDYDKLRTPGCGDVRDTIAKEYGQYGVSLHPTCADFTQSRHSRHFSFSALNTGDYQWALLRDPITDNSGDTYGLDKWVDEYSGGAGIINSAYRNPKRNRNVGGARQSRHMYGDAVDWRNEARTQDEYNARAAAARRAGADYIEPLSGPCGLGCVHADWRNHFGDYQD